MPALAPSARPQRKWIRKACSPPPLCPVVADDPDYRRVKRLIRAAAGKQVRASGVGKVYLEKVQSVRSSLRGLRCDGVGCCPCAQDGRWEKDKLPGVLFGKEILLRFCNGGQRVRL